MLNPIFATCWKNAYYFEGWMDWVKFFVLLEKSSTLSCNNKSDQYEGLETIEDHTYLGWLSLLTTDKRLMKMGDLI